MLNVQPRYHGTLTAPDGELLASRFASSARIFTTLVEAAADWAGVDADLIETDDDNATLLLGGEVVGSVTIDRFA